MTVSAGVGQVASTEQESRLSTRLRGYVALTKPRIVELLLITTVPTMFVASPKLPSLGLVLLVLAGGTLAAGGANACNMIYDRDIDAVMQRTKNRPLVTGAVSVRGAVVFALGLEIAAFLLLGLAVNLLSAVLAISAAAFYVGIYTMWLKRTSTQNIVIGGAAGAVPVLVGWSAVTGGLGLTPLLLFGIIFLWTPPHYWPLAVRYRSDYERASVPMLPVVHDLRNVTSQILLYCLALWACSVAVGIVGHLGIVFTVFACLLGGAFVARAVQLRADPTPKRAMQLFGFSITYLTLLFIGMGIDTAILHL